MEGSLRKQTGDGGKEQSEELGQNERERKGRKAKVEKRDERREERT